MDGGAQLRQMLAEAQDVLILGHTSPDGDCVGAMLAFAAAMAHLGKSRTLMLPDAIPASLAFLPGVDTVAVAPDELPRFDLAIIPDCSDLGRLGPLYERHSGLLDTVPIVNVDHHLSNARFGAVNIVDPSAAAVCEQLFFLFPTLGVPLDPEIAMCLLTGIVTDTQTFRTPSVTSRTMRTAAALYEAGAPLPRIADHVYNSRQLPSLRLWGLALSQIEDIDGVVWTRMNEPMLAASGATWEESEHIVTLLASVQTADVALLFKEMSDGSVRVSLRSDGRIDVAAVARQFGGGGHKGAAGCTVVGSFAEARALVVDAVRSAQALASPA